MPSEDVMKAAEAYEEVFRCDVCSRKEEHRHLAILSITERLLRESFRAMPLGRWYRVNKGIPNGAHLISAYYAVEMRAYEFLYEHPDFPAVPDGVAVGERIVVEVEEWAQGSVR